MDDQMGESSRKAQICCYPEVNDNDEDKNINNNKNKEKRKNIQKNIKCMYTNIDSFMNKRVELKTVIEDQKPDIIAITEMKPKNARYELQESEIQLENYSCISNISGSGRGVALYVAKALNYTEVEKLNSLYNDSVWCALTTGNKETVLIGCIYRSPNSEVDDNVKLNNLLIEVAKMSHDHQIITGDFNYPEIKWSTQSCEAGENHPATGFFETLKDCFFTQHITEATHHRGNQQANTLDLLLTNEEQTVTNVTLHAPIGCSHHSVILCETNMKTPADWKAKKVMLYDKGDYVGLNHYLSNIDWQASLSEKSVEDQWKLVKTEIQKGCDEFIPSYCKKENSKAKPIWMNENAIKKVRKKHASWRRYVETKDGRDYVEYCKARNQAKWETRKAIREFEKKIAMEAKKNPKAFYRYVSSQTKSRTGIPDLEEKDEVVSDNKAKCELFNNYFISVFTKEDSASMPACDKVGIVSEMEEISFGEAEIKNKLLKLKICKSPGPDGIHPRILKELNQSLALPLEILYNTSIEQGKLPSEWKSANVTPLHKKGSRKKIQNYRPISLTCVLCKVLESLIRDKIVAYMDENELWYEDQHGFLKGRSCMTQLLQVLEDWTRSMDNGTPVTTVFMDFAKAFDTVPHMKLLKKLEKYLIDAKVIQWVARFLSNRTQRVTIGGASSTEKNVTSGVPQGSVLGPVLFLLYINDLPDNIVSAVKLFADDTKIYLETETNLENEIIQEDLDKLEEWSRVWELKFNAAKCKVMCMGGSNHYEFSLMGDDAKSVKLQHTESEKDLGVILDSKLQFKEHIHSATIKGNQLVGMIRRSFTYLDSDTFVRLFKSLVRPILEYGNTVWSPYLKTQINEVERVQRRATRLVPGLGELHYEQRLRKLHLPTLEYRRWRGMMIETFKFVKGEYKIDPKTVGLTLDDNLKTRRHRFKLEKKKHRLNVRRNSYGIRVTAEWNALPDEVVGAESINAFKNRLDRHWHDRKFNPDYEWNKILS